MEVDVDPVVEVIETTESVSDAMSGLNEKIEKLVVKLKYMHDENDNLWLNFAKEKATLTKAFEAKIHRKDEEHRAKLEQEVGKEKASLTDSYEATILRKDVEIRTKAEEYMGLSKALQDKLDDAHKHLAEKEEELSRMKNAAESIQAGCGC